MKQIKDLISNWQNFYRNVFRFKADFSNLQIPIKQPGFGRLIIVSNKVYLERCFNFCQSLFPCYYEGSDKEDLIDQVVYSDRIARPRSYALWVCDQAESDGDYERSLLDGVKDDGDKVCVERITLEERLLFELKYFSETRKHLDTRNWTACENSHDHEGGFPYVGWRRNRLEIRFDYSSGHAISTNSRFVIL